MTRTDRPAPGPVFAVVTPFGGGSSRPVDYGALRGLLEFLESHGVRRIVANGTTGEFAALSSAERRAVLEACRSGFSGRIIAHVSSTCASEVHEAMAHAVDYADGVLVLPPYYYASPSPEGVVDFLADCATACPLPVYLYNFPRHTQAPLTPDVAAAVRQRAPGVVGYKDSSGSLENAEAVKRALGDGFEVVLGSDSLALRALESGLDGAVTGGALPVPELMEAVARRHRAGDAAGARAAQDALDMWSAARKAVAIAEPAAVKAALSVRIPGFPAFVRAPFREASDGQSEILRTAVEEIGATFT